MMLRHVLACWVAALCLAAVGFFLVDGSPAAAAVGHEIPSLTTWGKIFSVLLLAAFGVAYLVWRRPVLQAQAILETSPLGAGCRCAPLVDWMLYLKTVIGVETVALLVVWALSRMGRPLAWVDTLGVLGSGAIVAMVLHLLILAYNDPGRDK